MSVDKLSTATPVAAEPSSPIEFRLDSTSGVPTYLQIVQQVEQAVRLGYLKVDDQIPKVREVVGSLAVNPNTVVKAYRELEHRGLVAGRPGVGTFIVAGFIQVGSKEQAALRRRMLAWLTSAAGAGLDRQAMVALFTSSLREFDEAHEGDPFGEPGPAAGAEGVA
jgi:GntR family transcriptional regulator